MKASPEKPPLYHIYNIGIGEENDVDECGGPRWSFCPREAMFGEPKGNPSSIM
jgi:hypothetical protein